MPAGAIHAILLFSEPSHRMSSTAALPPPGVSTDAKRIPTLDGWRGIAILMVIVCHASLALSPGSGAIDWVRVESLGNQGVTIFFVLSGYLITSRLLLERDRNGSVSLRNFYIRRFFRLMPAAWAYLLFRCLLAMGNHSGLGSVYLVPSLLFFRNYLPEFGVSAATTHFWSLSIEEQFYLAWPTIFLLAGRKRAFWIAASGSMAIALWRFHFWTWLMAHPAAIYATQFRADALLVGCAAALVSSKLQPHLRKWMAFPALLAIGYNIAIGSSLVPLYESISIALLVLITSQNPSAIACRIFDWRPLAYIGLVSYSLYLWQETLFFARTVAGLLIALVLITVAALVSYYFVEKPSIEWGKRIVKRHAARAIPVAA